MNKLYNYVRNINVAENFHAILHYSLGTVLAIIIIIEIIYKIELFWYMNGLISFRNYIRYE